MSAMWFLGSARVSSAGSASSPAKVEMPWSASVSDRTNRNPDRRPMLRNLGAEVREILVAWLARPGSSKSSIDWINMGCWVGTRSTSNQGNEKKQINKKRKHNYYEYSVEVNTQVKRYDFFAFFFLFNFFCFSSLSFWVSGAFTCFGIRQVPYKRKRR